MKLIKKQLSACYVIKATASKSLKEQASPGGITKEDVANHGNSRLDIRPMASPPRQGRVHTIRQLLHYLSGERLEQPYPVEIEPTGQEKHSQLRERHPSCNVEEGPQSVPATEMASRGD